jgi:DNA-binding MarR family transcriptional regulator
MKAPLARARPHLELGPLLSYVGFFVRRAQVTIFDDFLRDPPIALTPGQLGILVVIEFNPGVIQRDLCAGVGLDKSTFATTVGGLVARKLVRQVPSRKDRRSNTLALTSKGRAALKTMLAHATRHERRVFGRLSAPEREQLIVLLGKVIESAALAR